MLVVGPPTPDRSKGRGQMKYTPWFSRFRVGLGNNNRTPEIIYYYDTSRAYGGR
jgi:hypothetical protein